MRDRRSQNHEKLRRGDGNPRIGEAVPGTDFEALRGDGRVARPMQSAGPSFPPNFGDPTMTSSNAPLRLRRSHNFVLCLGLCLAVAGCDVDPGDDPPDDDPPPGVAVDARWARHAVGEANGLVAVDIDDDGWDEIVVAGRRIAAFDGDLSSEPLWTLDLGSDLDAAYDLHLVDVAGPALLTVHAGFSVRLADAVTGAERWRVDLEQEALALRLSLFDAGTEEAFFPAGGRHAYSVASGERLWTAEALAHHTAFVVSAQLDGDLGRDLLMAMDDDAFGGIPFGAALDLAETEKVFAYRGDGTLLWSHALDGMIGSLSAADLDGDGRHAAVVGLELAVLAADAGGRLWEIDVDGFVDRIVAGDVDGSGVDTVFAAVNHWDGTSTLVAISAAGEVVWTHPVHGGITVLRLDDLDGSGRPELLVGSGVTGTFGAGGRLQALETAADATVRVRWVAPTHLPPLDLTPAWLNGEKRLVVVGSDTVVRAVDPATGAVDGARTAGRFVHATASGTIGGRAVVAWGDDTGHVHLADAGDGTLIWQRRLDVGGSGEITALAIDDLEGDGVGDVIVAALRHYDTRFGAVARFRGDGAPVFSQVVDEEVWAVQVADLDGDGRRTIVIAELAVDGMLDGSCGVRALSPDGETRWRRQVSTCMQPHIHVGEIDGEMRIGYAEITFTTSPHAALLDADGEIVWRKDQEGRGSWWVHVTPEGLIHGGATPSLDGHVTLHDGHGDVRWRTSLAPVPIPGTDRVLESYSRGGTVFPAADGALAVAFTTESGEARILDLATGEAGWERRLWPLSDREHDRPMPGPIAYVSGTGDTGGFLAVGSTEISWMAGEIFALGLDGEVLFSLETAGFTRAISPVAFADGRMGAVYGAGLSVHVVEGRAEE
jgi:outer membrane protein assembly factor BamB